MTILPPLPARAGVQEAQADMNESMQRRLENRRLRRKLHQERGSWDRALEVAARIAEIAGVYEPKVIAEMIRAVKVGSEDD